MGKKLKRKKKKKKGGGVAWYGKVGVRLEVLQDLRRL